jgi:membrane fusion protein, multidrug efflux system
MAELVETEQQELRAEEAAHAAPPRTFFRRHPRAKWALLAILVLLAVGGLATWSYYSVRESTDDAQIDGHIHPVNAKVGGTVLAVNVRENQYIEAGTVLVQIDTRDYQVAVDRARADLEEAEALLHASRSDVPIASATSASQLSGAEAGVEEARADLSSSERDLAATHARVFSAQARLREAQANYQKAARDLDRLKPLIAKEEISQQQYDAAVAAAEAFHAAVDSAQAQVNEAEAGVRVAQSRIERDKAKVAQAQATVQSARTAPQQVAMTRARSESAAARVQQARAALEQAQLNFRYTTVKAPLGGVVSRKAVEVGQIVQPGQALLAVVPLEDIWVTANFKETQLKEMRPGQKAVVSVDAYGGRKYQGHVDSIAAATGARFSLLPPENATGNYVKVVQRIPVKIIFEKGQDPENLLRPGMSVVPTVFTR